MLERLTEWLAGDAAADLVPSHFAFGAPLPPAACLALPVVAGLLAALYYWPRLDGIEGLTRPLLVQLRCAVVALLLFLVLDPAIVAQRVKPGEQFVLLLFDDSRSMRLLGPDGRSRGDGLKEAYTLAEEVFEGALKRRHQLARYRLGAGIEALQQVADLDFSQPETDLVGGIRSAVTDLQGTVISAVVLFSDGVQQPSVKPSSGEEKDHVPATIPIFTVGVDTAAHWRDLELTSLTVKRTDFDRSPVALTIGLRSTGLAGRKAMVEARLGPRIVESRLIELGEDRQEHEVRMDFVPDREGWLEYEARVRLIDHAGVADADLPPGDAEDASPAGVADADPAGAVDAGTADDRIGENNARRFIVDNRDKTYRILYVSGRPNWQNRFLRTALDGDEQLKLTSLIRISNAERKFVFRGKKSSLANPLFEGFAQEEDRPRYDEAVFLRMGAGENELLAGYPIRADELFGYDLIIWGDVERAFFTTAQMELTRDFVEKRGGTLLLLGGPNSFTEGKYAGTLIESLMPVLLHGTHQDPLALRDPEAFTVMPTIEGSLTGSWSFDTNLDKNREQWASLPPLHGLDRFPLLRAGATVMAEAPGEAGTEGRSASTTPARSASTTPARPVFAIQRYGEGKCALLAVSDTWQWRMHTDEKDQKHERLWRQVIRNLVHDTPDPVVLRAPQDTYTQGAPAAFEFIVRDALFDKREGLHATATLTTPSGRELTLAVDESIQETGLYSSRFTPEEAGLHTLRFAALTEKGETVATFEDALLVEPDQREFRNAQYDPAFLEDLSKPTGGALYTLAQLQDLARAIPVPPRQDAESVWLPLWHFPPFFFLLVAMMATEWYIRRRKGHP